jgi:HEAT repeat protein
MAPMRVRKWAARASRRATLVTVLLCVGGCDQGAARRRQLGSENPLDRTEAIVRAYQARDLRAVHKLVALLDDPSDAVRMYAIQALRRLCGVDYGYHYYASAAEREPAVARWRQALRDGEVLPRSSPPITVSDEEGAPATAGSVP